jgi:hypothetical protein
MGFLLGLVSNVVVNVVFWVLLGARAIADGRPRAAQQGSITIWHNGARSEITLANTKLAIVEKCHDPDREPRCLLPRITRRQHLGGDRARVRNWKHLDREFADAPFVILLGFPGGETYLT